MCVRERERENAVLSFLSLFLRARGVCVVLSCDVHFFLFGPLLGLGTLNCYPVFFFSSFTSASSLHKKFVESKSIAERYEKCALLVVFFVLANVRARVEDDFYALRESYDGTSSNILAFFSRAACV